MRGVGDVALCLVTVSGGVGLRGVGYLLYLFGLEVSFCFRFLSDCDDRDTTSPLASESEDESLEEVSCFLFLDVAFFFLAYFFTMAAMLCLISKICRACFLSVSSLSSTTLAAAAASACAFLFLQAITDWRFFSLLAASCGSLKEKVNFFISVHLKRLILIK